MNKSQFAENCKIVAIRLFKSRAEVKNDWHWRKDRREHIRNLIWTYRNNG